MNTLISLRGLRLPVAVITLGAFLVFQVQPLIAKRILPWFGGSAAVWTACLLCFQVLLLAGYGYAHLLQKLPPRRQAQIHTAMLLLSLLRLPIIPSAFWKPTTTLGDPTLQILALLLATMGLPYLMLSTTSPMLQAWLARRNPGWQPYRLFAISNVGSLLALLSYPVLVEPFLTLGFQAWLWSGAYGLYALGAAAIAWSCRDLPLLPRPDTGTDEAAPGAWRRILWVTLAFAPSLLLVAGTAHLCTNVAPIPFLWVAPLAIYLLSFILCFDHPRWATRGLWTALLIPSLAAMALLSLPRLRHAPVAIQIPVLLMALFSAAMICHGELARLKPGPRHLTSFYLALALGGALGGVFAAVVAPRIFASLLELPLALALIAILALGTWLADSRAGGGRPGRLLGSASLGFLLALAMGVLAQSRQAETEGVLESGRNFYGALRVKDKTDKGLRLLLHGTINHGGSFLDPARATEPVTYYGPQSGVGLALRSLQARGPVRVGVLGLGCGSLLAYARPQDHWTVYEINPLVVHLAHKWFSNLDRVKPELIMGDGRLSLEGELTSKGFDLLAMDAFSSDAIPVHLLTAQAFVQYRRHLRPGGILAINITNRYLDMVPVLRAEAAAIGWQARLVEDSAHEEACIYSTKWVLMSSGPACFQQNGLEAAKPLSFRRSVPRWTDDFSNLYRILK